MISDLKYALRQLTKAPGFAAVTVLILALGIASNTAVFSVINAMLLRGLSVQHPEQLVVVYANRSQGGAFDRFPVPAYEQFRRQSQTIADFAALDTSDRTLVATGFGRSDSVAVEISGVSGNYFPFFEVPPLLGRTLGPADDVSGAARQVAVISQGLWKRQFGSDPAVLGRAVTIDRLPVTIVGIASRGFTGVETGTNIDLWIPLHLYPVLDPSLQRDFSKTWSMGKMSVLTVFGRMKPASTPTLTSSELDGIFRGWLAGYGLSAGMLKRFGYLGMDVLPGGSGYNPIGMGAAPLLRILMVIVGAVLLIACANVAGLLIARASRRQHEFALRGALGAGRAILVRQLLIESFLLAMIGGALGMLLSQWGTRILAGYLPGSATFDLSPDAKVFIFAAGISTLTGILVGVIPALRFTRLDLVSALKQQSSTQAGGASQRINRSLVVAQIALSMCLLTGAGLFARTLQNLRNVDTGFNRTRQLAVSVHLPKGANASRRATASQEAIARLQALPGVQGVTFSWGGGGFLAGELGGASASSSFSADGYVPPPGALTPGADVIYVGPNFFTTLGIPLVEGRGITAADDFPPGRQKTPATGVIVVSESLARRYFPGGSALGREIRIPDDVAAAMMKAPQSVYRIIGVVRDTKQRSLRDRGEIEAFLPCTAIPNFGLGFVLEMRTSDDPFALLPAIKETLKGVDPHLTAPAITTLGDAIDRSTAQESMVAKTAGGFSFFALILAILGLYGLLAYNVSRRTREIGLRMALGADSHNLLAMVLRQGLVLTAVGCIAGTVAAVGLERLIASRLYGVHPFDSPTFLATSAMLFITAFLACWLPARRATKVDPMVALRTE